MSNRRSRSVSNERSGSGERGRHLPHDAKPISESDYFLRSAEFKAWLKEEKGKYFDELSSEKAHSQFRKFVKAWNKGKLTKTLYAGVDHSHQVSSTAFKWSFKTSGDDLKRLKAARDEIEAVNYGSSKAGPSTFSGRTLGPTLPSTADVVLARETAEEQEAADRSYKRKRDRQEAKERVEDMVGPKEVGRAGMLEAKRAKRDNDRAFRERGDEGFVEADEGTLMGGGDSFQERIRQRDAARRRFEERKRGDRDERATAARERQSTMRDRDSATMDMFKKMAAERFG